jgi:multiple sugar transport system substrate-binding protein
VRYGLPLIVGVSVLFYRTDLIPQLPTTWAEYEKVLAANTGGGKYGLSFAGVPAQLVKLFLARYWSQGDALLTPEWKPLINSEKGVKAAQMLLDYSKKYAPPGVLAWDNPDASNAFLNGDAAVLEGWGGFILGSINDPAKSKVVDKWAIGPYPEKGTGNATQHNMVIFKQSKNPQAAFDFMAYATNPAAQKQSVLQFGIDAARASLYTDAEVVAKKPYLPDYAKVLEAGKPFTPGVPQWLEMFIGLAEGMSAILSEKSSPKDGMDEVAKKWEELIKQAPLSFPYAE